MSLLNQRYRKLEDLSSGGFGDTFLAEDTQMPSSRTCVIKRLRPVTHDPEFYQLAQQRFFREAVILEKLGQHPQIPALYAYFEEGNQFYLVQEWIPGTTLEDLIRQQGALGAEFMIPFLLNLLTVLTYVHQQQIIHRDIKPANIILRQSDNAPVLIDFGAVKEIVSSFVSGSGQPSPTIMIGTPGFIAPEQVHGHPCFASDLFSLAYTAIYALTGQDPRSSPQYSEAGQLSHWLRSLPLLPGLQDVLERASSPTLSQRYRSAMEMQQALLYASQQASSVPSSPQTPASNTQTPTIAVSPAPDTSRVVPRQASGFPKWLLGLGLFFFLLGGAIAASVFILRRPNSPSTNVSPPTPKIEPPQSPPEPPPQAPPEEPPFDPKFKIGDTVQISNVEQNDFLAVHSAAGIQHKFIGCLPYNAQNIRITGAEVTLNEAAWYPVAYLGLQGWASSKYLASQASRIESLRLPEKPTSILGASRQIINISPNDTDPVLFILDQPGVRNAQGEDNVIVGCIPYDGTDISVTEIVSIPGQSDWAKVWYQGFEGWVNSRYLSAT